MTFYKVSNAIKESIMVFISLKGILLMLRKGSALVNIN